MVLFDQLRISDDGKRMYINVRVNGASFFKNVYIESITITTADKVSETAIDLPTDFIYQETFEGNVKEVNLVLTCNDFLKRWEDTVGAMKFSQAEMSKNLFFVYVKCNMEGMAPSDPCVPCRFDEEITLGVVFDEALLYQKVMCYIRYLADNCTVPREFTDFILLWNAFKASVETEHYISAIDFYKKLFGKADSICSAGISTGSNCGCHG
jgi:hypothetical protein